MPEIPDCPLIPEKPDVPLKPLPEPDPGAPEKPDVPENPLTPPPLPPELLMIHNEPVHIRDRHCHWADKRNVLLPSIFSLPLP